jgi:autophagy-related protein 13
MIMRGKGKGDMGLAMGVVGGFGGFDNDDDEDLVNMRGEEELEGSWSWREGSESVVFGRVGEVDRRSLLDVVHEGENEEDHHEVVLGVGDQRDDEEVEEDEVTPVMRLLEDLGSSVELSGGSTVGVGSVGSEREGSAGTGVASGQDAGGTGNGNGGGGDSATLAEPAATRSRKMSSTTLLRPGSSSSSRSRSRTRIDTSTAISATAMITPGTYSPAHSELLKIHQRHSRSRTQSTHSASSLSSSASPHPHTTHLPLLRDREHRRPRHHHQREHEHAQDRETQTAKLKRRTRVVSGAVGALVLAVAGWRIFSGVTGPVVGANGAGSSGGCGSDAGD